MSSDGDQGQLPAAHTSGHPLGAGSVLGMGEGAVDYLAGCLQGSVRGGRSGVGGAAASYKTLSVRAQHREAPDRCPHSYPGPSWGCR
jgi:hypothetical protein